MSRKPLIGITPSPSHDNFDHGEFERFALANTYTTAVEAAGGVPLIIPPQEGNIEQLLDTIDGLLLSGGGDIEPKHFGDSSQHEKTYGVHRGRDELELALAHGALERDMPILCICRGIQVLNVALGGTLYQDVDDQLDDHINHRQQTEKTPKHDPSHSVSVEPDTLLAKTYGADAIEVNSFHHQGLWKLGDGLRVNAISSDGLVEAVDYPDRSWVLGVQWHPEMMYRAHAEHRSPFEGLTAACRGAVLA